MTPEMNEERQNIKRALLSAAQRAKGDRWQRLLRRPLKTLTPYVMRKIGLRRSVTVQTVWGGRFSGVLPEAVSSEIWRNGSFELPVSLSLNAFLPPGGTFVDIGAHFGYFTLLASRLVGADGRVLSIEAMPSTHGYLRRNVEANATQQNVETRQCAAYSHDTELEFTDFGLVASSLNSAFGARDTHGIISSAGTPVKVRARAADEIIAEAGLNRVDVIKIDAESSEQFVLDGLRRTISRHDPVIIMELGDVNPADNSVANHLGSFKALGYHPFVWNSRAELVPFTPEGRVSYANVTFRKGVAAV